MGDRCINPSIRSFRKPERNESQDVTPLDESICIPVVSNTVVIKNSQAKVLGDPVIPWNEISYLFLPESGRKSSENKVTRQSVDGTENLIDFDDYFETVSSSDGSEVVPEKSAQDVLNLPATLRLLEEVHFRILGDRAVSVPQIEKVITNATENESDQEEEEVKDKAADEEEEEESIEDKLYLDAAKYSELFVNSILQSAKQMCKYKHGKNVVLVGFSKDLKFQNIVWPTIENFNVKAGGESIDKYISCAFSLEEAWKYKVTFLIGQSDRVSDFYLYDAKFCIPTCSYPIAQATVSVFFTIEVSRVIPKNVPVRATFTIESLRTVMTPGEVEINDEMLLRVLYAKLEIFKHVRF